MPEVTGQHRPSLLNGFLASTGSTHTSPALRMFLLCRVDVAGGAPSHWLGQSGHQVGFNLAVANDSTSAAQYYSILPPPENRGDGVEHGRELCVDLARAALEEIPALAVPSGAWFQVQSDCPDWFMRGLDQHAGI